VLEGDALRAQVRALAANDRDPGNGGEDEPACGVVPG
jgi:hypothetical protein